MLELSVVIPVMNEQDNIFALAEKVSLGLNGLDWECIWVNDGSTDQTLSLLKDLFAKDKRFRYIDLDGNFGQSAALMVGFQNANSNLIGTLDGDGQNDPADLKTMVGLIHEKQVDVVNGYRAKRNDSLFRKIASKIGNGTRNFITRESEVKDVGCSTRVFKKECISHLPLWKGMHRFLPTLIKLKGYKLHQIPVQHYHRTAGVTKYTLNNRLWVGIYDLFAVRWMQNRMVFPKVKDSSNK